MKFKVDQTSQKLRGGYYTPQNLADFVAQWVLTNNPENVLEPSCGDGVFFEAIANNQYNPNLEISGFELFDTEAERSRNRCQKLGLVNTNIHEGDFLSWFNKNISQNTSFSGVLGNPPFIRYQFLEKNFQEQAELIFKRSNLRFTKHTNAWVPFIIASINLLEPGGRLGMVIPSEIIHVMHAQSLRTYLGEVCRKIVIIDPQEIWFEDTLQGAVIIFAEKKQNTDEYSEGVGIVSVKGTEFLTQDPNTIFDETTGINGQTVVGKWTRALLSPDELNLINEIIEHPNVFSFNEIATVDVGMVTGANNFFLVPNTVVEEYELQDFVHPMFGRSQHCRGIVYNTEQHLENANANLPVNFVYLTEDKEEYPAKVQQYIAHGEEQELHKRYKCRIRKPWYKVPSMYSTELGMLKRSHEAPRLIFNEMKALTTDTAYRVRNLQFTAQQLSYFFINPLTAIFAELEGRSYGGGVLELVPSEVEKLYVPIIDDLDIDLNSLDYSIRTHSMTETLLNQGSLIFTALGFNEDQIATLMRVWTKLKKRRQRTD
jgi:adenine-specific DNA methylase